MQKKFKECIEVLYNSLKEEKEIREKLEQKLNFYITNKVLVLKRIIL